MIKIKELEQKINKARKDYYNNEPTVSDQVFDSWVDELKSLDPENLEIISIGAQPVSEWVKDTHKISMGSLNKVNYPEELSKWYIPGNDLLVTEKLDGISINCEYENGVLIKALTRGDGEIGENIISNVLKMQGVKKYIPNFTGSLRGEILLKKSIFKQHFSDKANTRNAASGISKRLDGKGCEHLTVMFYGVYGNLDLPTECHRFNWLDDNELLFPNFIVRNNDKEAIEIWQNYQENNHRENLDYDIDGLVIRFDQIDFQESLGENHSRPKGAIAFKFDHKYVETELIDVEWQVGNSGRITPVAILKPVMCAGVEIRKASLHNVSKINELQLYKGCTVLISRRNDVIPYVEQKVK